MNAIPEELQKTFDEARVNLLRARAAYIKMTEIEKEHREAIIEGDFDLSPYDKQEQAFETALGRIIAQVYDIYTYHSEPQDPSESISSLLILFDKGF